MSSEGDEKRPEMKSGIFSVVPGQGLKFTDVLTVENPVPNSTLSSAMSATLRAYRKSASQLVENKFAAARHLVPPHLRSPCHILVLCCTDGVIVRYDLAGTDEPKVRSADYPQSLQEATPGLTEQVIHFPDDPTTYVPQHRGPGFSWFTTDQTGTAKEVAQLFPVIYAQRLPPDFPIPPPPAHPPCLVSLHKEFKMHLQGIVQRLDVPAGSVQPPVDHFIARGTAPLPVGWQAVEIYPRLSEAHWKPEFAATWAEVDLLTAIATANAEEVDFSRLDGRAAAREHYGKLLEELETLLGGPEEPAHQFLKAHPELISPTHDAIWSKHAFGGHVSDFVFREPLKDYLLVEIEAPHRKLFRKDGQPRVALTHAIDQIDDWLSYIQDHKEAVERDGLTGISPTPRCLVVIGRSLELTESNRLKLRVLSSQRPRLTILTYDDLILRARTTLERLYGPLSIAGHGFRLYFFRGP